MSAQTHAPGAMRRCPTCGADEHTPCHSLKGNPLPPDRFHVDRSVTPPTGQLRAVPRPVSEDEIRADERERTAKRIEAWALGLRPASRKTAIDAADVAREQR